MKYRIGAIDQNFAPNRLTVSYVAICAGAVDTDLLRRAFAHTCRRFPMLRGRLRSDGGDCYVHIIDSDHDDAVTETVHSSVAEWLARGLDTVDPAVRLATLEIVHAGATTAVALRVSHAIGDAHLGFELLTELWRTATALAAGALADPAPVLPRRLEELLHERGIPVPDVALPAPNGLYRFTPTETLGRPGLRLATEERITLSDRDTGALLRLARAQGTTVHALLSAAVIRAERAMIAETSGAAPEDELPMIIGHAVDLRPHLTPPAPVTDTSNGLGYAPTVTLCGPEADLLTLGKEVKAQIVYGIDSGTALATMFAAARSGQSTPDTAVNILTNWGVVPALECPEGMEVLDFRGFVTGDSVPELSYFVYTFRGRLSIEFTYAENHHHRTRIAALRRLVAGNLAELIYGLARQN
ncbi:phthiocerol/phthiodiolone dimycocerosyl transferase family protein [Nocardia brasiliensis]|uniref:phthiocerol/phthiodiolone dimycocerosyl transferase family protein n=1 Tax=Nocardia brasiliensis TaxID=37326 RepID=UPI0024549D6B|nr:hypothetical protein [Nocardia brasiliensis]